jgi:hypothetical protein
MKQGIKIIICSLILVLVLAPAFDAHGSLSQKRVLVLYSEDKAHPAHELTDRGIRAVFQSNRFFEVQFYTSGGESRLGRFQFWGSQSDITERNQAEQQILQYQEPILEIIRT